MLISLRNSIIAKRWGILAVIIGTTLGFISAVICVYANLVIFGFNIMFIISPLIAGFSEAYVAQKKYGRSTGAISALLIFIIINIYGWFFPKNPITLNLFTLGGIALTIQAAVPILVNYLLFVVFLGTITYVIGLVGNLISKLLGKEIEEIETPKTADLPQLDLLFATTTNLNGKKIVKELGLITGEAILKEEKDENSSRLEKIASKNGSNIEYKIGLVRNNALQNLESEAKKLGANGILGVNIDYRSVGGIKGSTVIVTATGSAVLYE
ncbi:MULTISPECIES: heavy metal-binding domain-containing protein [Methanobacterium]|uniref:Heavy metal-binding domain-containing protein n=1 Tax=Methanobacterium veterum TaxID=408577 RepID=A0A9E4ZT95_9EURY|nr:MULTISPECIES: heavy metal-binding domain-containing protein [Methanobacterium]MCZ3364471.1 heavy metal-binding domain-containing protein [Methanobacterium veterum]MCZ3372223.1 heavy metal-binding domain-containing protein [Methanobacterium veterum]